jgi:Cu/Zn superoxide dismutase
MKNTLILLNFFLFCLLTNTFYGQKEVPVDPKFTSNLTLVADLNAAQEVPANASKATGFVTITFDPTFATAKIQGTVTGLSAAVTGAHIHAGNRGANGSVVFNFTSNVKDGKINAKINVTKDQLATFLKEGYYVNVHTSANTGGEIRGQVVQDAPLAFACVASAAQEVPANASKGTALATVLYYPRSKTAEVKVQYQDLSGPQTGFHFHKAPSGTNGSVVQNLAAFVSGSTVNTVIPNVTWGDSLAAGLLYLNIHTAANTGGEIRGQLTRVPGIFFDGWASGSQEVPVINTPAKALFYGTMNESLDSVAFTYLVDSLSGQATSAHIHGGSLGSNGGVLVNFTPNIVGNTITRTNLAIAAVARTAILNGGSYLNIHTAANAGGEIRGQIYKAASETYGFDLCQDQEVTKPVNAGISAGSGAFSYSRNRKTATISLQLNQMSSAITGAHIHTGARGVNGGVLYNFGSRIVDNKAYFDFDTTLVNTLATQALAGTLYFNVHTSNNTGGEIRGQIESGLECLVVNTYDIDGTYLKIYPNPAMNYIQIESDEENFQLSIKDIYGRTHITSSNKQIDISKLNGGMYYVTSKIKGEEITSRFLKL